MTLKVWVGGAPAVAQSEKYALPIDIEGGQIMTATIGGKSITYEFPSGPIRKNVAAAFVNLWAATTDTVPEFAQVDISDNGDGSFTLESETPGMPYFVTILIGDGTNEKQLVTMQGTITGGTFTLTFNGQTTDPIAYDASAATVQTELEALSNIEVGDVDVTGVDGGPWTIEFKGNLADTDVSLLDYDDTLLEATNEQQTITLASCSGGTFALTFDGQTTDPIAYNASAATIESELEALLGIGAGNVSVSGSGPWVVEFVGTLRGTDVDQIMVDGSNLTGVLAASIAETTPGGNGVNERWLTDIVSSTSSSLATNFRLTGNGSVSSGTFDVLIVVDSTTIMDLDDIPYDVTIAELQELIEAELASYSSGRYVNCVAVRGTVSANGTTGSGQLSDGDNVSINLSTGIGINGGTVAVTVDSTGLAGGTYSKTNPGTIGWSSDWLTGLSSFYLTVGGESTDDLDFSSTAAQIVTALEGLSTVGAGNVQVTLSDESYSKAILIEFIGDLANQDTGMTVVMDSNATVVNKFTTKVLNGAGGTSEVQTLSIAGGPGSGTFALSFDGVDTDLLDYDSTAEEIETALEALPGIGAGNVSCSGGALPGSDVVITFAGSKAGLDIDPIVVIFGVTEETVKGGGDPTVDVQTTQTILTKTVIAESSGPNDWNTDGNWDTLEKPVNADSVLVPDGDDILYGLDQSDLTLALLHYTATATQMGLPRRDENGNIEYRDRHLKVTAAEIIIDSNSQLINIDVMDSSPTIEVLNSGSGRDGEYAVQIIGENSANTASLLVLSGNVGVAKGPKEAAYLKTITQRGGQLWIGQDVGLEDVERTGGQFHSDRTSINGTLAI
ncbi:hypothetical protein [Gimesia algae]|uniref:Uncharacterized protein n=1 Tax=Gimesia algae TaxID=2527971 RepID=A0A517VMB7_9PLAN|nr:hypothetical protein [Gimesia algae]QDT94158.1 hypothetical protein Pan161_58510 [Gimesia algae]